MCRVTVDGAGWLATGRFVGKPGHRLVSISKTGTLVVNVITDEMPHNPVSSPDGRYARVQHDPERKEHLGSRTGRAVTGTGTILSAVETGGGRLYSGGCGSR